MRDDMLLYCDGGETREGESWWHMNVSVHAMSAYRHTQDVEQIRVGLSNRDFLDRKMT
jgi:hypothetical protein